MEKFWMVLGNCAPVIRHQTEALARKEAERLLRLHPASEFIVLESIASVKIVDVVVDVVWVEHEQQIPF